MADSYKIIHICNNFFIYQYVIKIFFYRIIVVDNLLKNIFYTLRIFISKIYHYSTFFYKKQQIIYKKKKEKNTYILNQLMLVVIRQQGLNF